MAITEVAVLSWAQSENYFSFLTSQGDLGNYNQAFFTTVSGSGFFYYTTNIPSGSQGTVLAVHFSPTFFALAPIYAISPGPLTLIVVKQLALAFAAVPLYGLAKTYFRGEAIPVLFAGIYLASPLATTVDWNSIDPEAFIPISLLFAMYFFSRGKFWPFIICWIVAAGTIEAAPPLLLLCAGGALVGTLVFKASGSYWSHLQQRRPMLVALLVAGAVLGLGALSLYSFGPRGGGFGSAYARRYSVLGATSVPDVVVQAVRHPHLALKALGFGGPSKAVYLEVLLLGGGIVWIFGGLRYLLPVAGFLGLVLLANQAPMYSLGSDYVALASGFVFAGAIEGSAHLSDVITGLRWAERRERLKGRLLDAAKDLARLVEAGHDDGERRALALRHLQSAVELLGLDDLAGAERKLQKAEVALGLAPAAWAAFPSLQVVAPDSVPARQPRGSFGPAVEARRRRAAPTLLLVVLFAIFAGSVMVIASVSNPFESAPLAGNPVTEWGVVVPTPDDAALSEALNLIPPGASVLTTAHLFPQLSSRHNAYLVPTARYLPGNETIEEDFANWVNRSQFVALDYNVDRKSAEVLITEVNLSGFHVMASDDGAVVYERGPASSPPVLWSPYEDSFSGATLRAPGSNVSSKYSSALGDSLYHAPGGQKNETLWQGPGLFPLPLGNYSATLDLELQAPDAGAQLRLTASATPAVVEDTPQFESDGETYYQATVHQQSVAATRLAIQSVSLPSPTSGFEPLAEQLNFTLSDSSYLDFAGIEVSTTMAVYLVSVQLTELNGLS